MIGESGGEVGVDYRRAQLLDNAVVGKYYCSSGDFVVSMLLPDGGSEQEQLRRSVEEWRLKCRAVYCSPVLSIILSLLLTII